MLPLRSVWQRNFRPILTVLWELLRDGLAVPERRHPFANSRSSGNPVLAKAVGLLPGSPDSASPPDRRGTIVAGALVPAFRVERSAHGRYTWYLCPLASPGFQAVLALEVAGRSATAAQRHTPAHRSDGEGGHNWGRRARCRRTLAKAWHSGFTADGSQVLAKAAGRHRARPNVFAALENLRQESCTGHHRL